MLSKSQCPAPVALLRSQRSVLPPSMTELPRFKTPIRYRRRWCRQGVGDGR